MDSLDSAEESFAQLNSVQNLIEDSIKNLNEMGVIPQIIDNMATVSNTIGNSIDKIFPVSQIDISSQISSLLSNIDTSRY